MSKYLLEHDPYATIDAVRLYGMLAFMTDGYTVNEVAKLAAAAILELDQRNHDLSSFFMHTAKRDDSYKSVTYELKCRSDAIAFGQLFCTIVYDDLDGLVPRADDVIRGPIVARERGEAIVAALNASK